MTATTITTATFIRRLDGWCGDARRYRLSQPTTYYRESGKAASTNYVIVSAIELPSAAGNYGGCETYIFPASEAGEVLSWGELKGSTKGTIFHEVAIEEAGWVLR